MPMDTYKTCKKTYGFCTDFSCQKTKQLRGDRMRRAVIRSSGTFENFDFLEIIFLNVLIGLYLHCISGSNGPLVTSILFFKESELDHFRIIFLYKTVHYGPTYFFSSSSSCSKWTFFLTKSTSM